MRLETIRDLQDLKNLETRRDETRFSSRLAEKCDENLILSSFIGLPLDKKWLIFVILGLFSHFRWVWGLKVWYLKLCTFGLWVETAFWRDETRQEKLRPKWCMSRHFEKNEILEMRLETIRDFQVFKNLETRRERDEILARKSREIETRQFSTHPYLWPLLDMS